MIMAASLLEHPGAESAMFQSAQLTVTSCPSDASSSSMRLQLSEILYAYFSNKPCGCLHPVLFAALPFLPHKRAAFVAFVHVLLGH